MSLKFRGDYTILRKYVSRVDSRGSWRDLKYGGKQYRTENGAVLNWWEKSGKILFQGHGLAALEFEQGFKAIASTKGRLANASTKSLEGLRKENEALRQLIANVLLESARLKKQLSRHL
jgi:hypothetical protein